MGDNNKKNSAPAGWAGLFILCVVIGGFLFEGFGAFAGVIVAAVIVLTRALKGVAAGSGGSAPYAVQRPQRQGRGDSPFYGTSAGLGQRAPHRAPAAGSLPAYGSAEPPAFAGGASGDAHLCDPGQHPHDGDRPYAQILDELEPGYFSTSGSMPTSHVTEEQFRKKQTELRSLCDAGMISNDEFSERLAEYRARMR